MAATLHKQFIFEPNEGYNILAPFIDDTKWSQFWRDNEAPLVNNWLKSLPKGKGLDAGSGTGPYISSIDKEGQECIAFDISERMLEYNKKKHSNSTSINYLTGSLSYPLPFLDNQLDWILCTRVLSHVPDFYLVLSEFSRVLKKGGSCFITDIHPNHRYNNTGFRIYPDDVIFPEGLKINIKTYKHLPDVLKENAHFSCHFLITHYQEYSLSSLIKKPSVNLFPELYKESNRSIFYTLEMERK